MTGEISEARYRQVLSHFATGVTVVAATAPTGPVGTTIGSFFSISLEPPLIGFCVGANSSSWPAIRDVGAFCVSVLAADQEEICRTFATKGIDKFAAHGWSAVGSSSPRMNDALAWIDCDIEAVHEAGDHYICVGRVREMGIDRTAEPLLFFRGGYSQIGP